MVIVTHFAAVLTVVTATGTAEFPPPHLAVAANQWALPYLRLTHLTNAYRFFARNPGPVDLVWFRVRFQGGRVRWVEWPAPDTRWLGVRQRQDMGTAVAIRGQLVPPAPGQRWPVLQPAGEAWVSSFARYLARTETAHDGAPVTGVQAFLVAHRLLLPYEIQMGWRPTDLRLYQPMVPLGTYDPTGRRVASPADASESAAASPSFFARWVIEEDVHTGAAAREGHLAVPEPIRDVLVSFPRLRTPAASGEALRAEIERLVLSADTPERIRDPARRAYELALRAPAGDRGGR